MTEKLQTFVDALKQKDPAWVLDVVSAHGETTVFVGRENIIDACIFLRDEHHFDMLADLCGGDLGRKKTRDSSSTITFSRQRITRAFA